MPKAKGSRVDDAFKINDENERILELWFIASVSEKSVEQHNPSSYLFVSNVDGQEERKLLSSALDSTDGVPASLEVCFFRRKMMFAFPDVDRFLNSRHAVALYRRSLPDCATVEARTSPARSTASRRERARRPNDDAASAAAFSLDGAVCLLEEPLDCVSLLSEAVARLPVRVPPGCGLRDVAVEARAGRPLLPAARLRRYRPMRIELRALHGVPPALCAPCVSMHFGPLSFVTPPLAVAPDGAIAYRRVFFLGTRTPLDVWRDFLMEPLRVAVLDGSTCIGAGTVSLRAAATDGQTHFSDAAPLLPSRATNANCFAAATAAASAVQDGANCLTCGAEVSLRVDLFVPLPTPRHVLPGGAPAAGGAFLTRGVARMPFAARWTARALDAMLRALLKQPRAAPHDGDVQPRVAPRPDAVDGADAPESPVEARRSPSVRARSKKGQPEEAPRPPTPPADFDAPLEVVTPPGISGFEVMDDDTRILCIEGPAAAVHEVLEQMAAAAGYDPRLKVMMNAELFIPRRAYLSFPPLVTLPASTVEVAEVLAPVKPVAEKRSAEGRSTGNARRPRSKSSDRPPPPPPPPPPPVVQAPAEDTFDSAEAEAGATGGRLHRMRLRETIGSLVAQQQFLVRSALSADCVRCYTRLHALCGCASLREAFERDLFPTPAELIALERAFGVTLELADVFGREAFAHTALPAAAAAAVVSGPGPGPCCPGPGSGPGPGPGPCCPGPGPGPCGPGPGDSAADDAEKCAAAAGVCLAALSPADVGRLVGFDAVRVERRRVPASVARRHPHAWWMRVCAEPPIEVLCAFPAGAQPAGTIRCRVEAQVVRCADTLCLYALACTSLAQSHTDSRNTAYDERLLLARRDKARRLVMDARQGGGAYHCSTNKSNKSNCIKAGGSYSGNAAAQDDTQTKWPERLESESDDEDRGADSPPREQDAEPRALPQLAGTAVSRDAGTAEKRKLVVARDRRSRTLVARKPPDVLATEYELCWELYNRRAPPAQPQRPKGPPMHF